MVDVQQLKSKAWHLSNLAAEVERIYDETQGEVTPTIENLEQVFEGKVEDLIIGLCQLRVELEGRLATCKQEIERLKDVAERAEKEDEWAKDRLRELALAADGKVKAGTYTVWTQAPPKKCIVNIAPELLPEEFQKTTVTAKVAEIKAALEGGQEVPGCKLATGEPVVRVR